MECTQKNQRNWSDWGGFACFSFLACLVVWRSPEFTLFLAPLFLYELFTAIAFLVRQPMRAQATGWRPHATAYAATFLMPIMLVLARTYRSGWLAFTAGTALTVIAFCFWLAGMLAALWAVLSLRAAFSLVPQARRFVAHGPYRYVRHPMYLCYTLQYAAILATHANAALLIVCVVWLGLTILRIQYEEKLLLQCVPEYADYRAAVPMLIPAFTRKKMSPAFAELSS